MAYIYMDESGDLWFNLSNSNSQYFIITFLISNTEKDCENVMKKAFKRMSGKNIKRNASYFHSNKEHRNAVKKVIDLANRRDFKIVALIADKKHLSERQKSNIHQLYNTMVGNLLEQCETRGLITSKEDHFFVASRRETNKTLNADFIKHLETITSDLVRITAHIKSPWEAKGLEIVDAISFSLYQKREFKKSDLCSILENKIEFEIFFQ